MKIELTEKEKQMMTEGIVFSTTQPVPMFVKEGMNGGKFVCNAFLCECFFELLIFEKQGEENFSPIAIGGKNIDKILIESYIDVDEDRICSNVHVKIKYEGTLETEDFRDIFSNSYEGLPIDTQAKLFFIDFLKIYLEEKKQNEAVAGNAGEETASQSNDEEGEIIHI